MLMCLEINCIFLTVNSSPPGHDRHITKVLSDIQVSMQCVCVCEHLQIEVNIDI